MTVDELSELERLRAFKREHDGSALSRSFYRLEQMMDAPYKQGCDTVMSVRTVKIVYDALVALKDEVLKNGTRENM